MNHRQLAKRRARYLWTVRNVSPAHREQLRRVLWTLRTRRTRSQRREYEAHRERAMRALGVWNYVTAMMGVRR